ncbi:MAG: hemolysin family protein [Bacillota bacterium]|nr:hemolysin family protein [Bacillota bacterium]
MLILILTIINGFFAATEIAFVSLDKNKLRQKSEDGDKKSELLLDILGKPSRFLSTIQVGITFAGFFSSASAAVGISGKLGAYLSSIGVPFAKNISFIGITLLLSYFVLVFGELVPKRIALQSADKFSRIAVKPISVIAKIMKPFISLLSFSTNTVARILGYSTEGVEEEITLEEIRSIIEVGEEQGVIETTEKDMINSIMSFDNKLGSEVMTSRTDTFMIDINRPIKDFTKEIFSLKYSRIPVYEENKDNIIGILYLKDLIPHLRSKEIEEIDIKKLLRKAYFIPERKKINQLFVEMQKSKSHIAILIDQYGGFSGIVTMEDLLEEIVGEIEDEYDVDGFPVKIIDKDNYLAEGNTSIKEINRILNTDIDELSQDYDTLSGFIIHELQRLPIKGIDEVVKHENIEFKIKEIDNNKIKEVLIKKIKKNKDN